MQVSVIVRNTVSKSVLILKDNTAILILNIKAFIVAGEEAVGTDKI